MDDEFRSLAMPNDAHLILLFLEEQERFGKKSGTINHRRLERNAFLESVGSFDVTPRRIQNWFESKDLEVSTRRTYLWHYSEFYKWALRHSYLDDNPASRIIPPEERRPPQVLSFTISDLERAMDATRDVVRMAPVAVLFDVAKALVFADSRRLSTFFTFGAATILQPLVYRSTLVGHQRIQ
jgi:integrase